MCALFKWREDSVHVANVAYMGVHDGSVPIRQATSNENPERACTVGASASPPLM